MTSRDSRDHSPLRTSSSDVRRQSTAYRGASYAFSSAAPANLLPKAYLDANGALAAATSAGMGRRGQGIRLAEGATSDGQKAEASVTPRRSGSREKVAGSREKSPSFAAALHATAKSPPASTRSSLNSTLTSRRPSPFRNPIDNGVHTPVTVSRSTDEAVIGATSSLVSLFESKQKSKKNVPTTYSVRYVTKPTLAIASPVPTSPSIRPTFHATTSLSTSPLSSGRGEFIPSSSSKVKDTGATAATGQLLGRPRGATTRSGTPTKLTKLTPLPRIVPEPPAPRRSGAHVPSTASQERGRNTSGNLLRSNPLALAQAQVAEPGTILRPSPSDPAALPLIPSPDPPTRPRLPARSTKSFESKVDSMANTIVAASLASSRAPSPTKPPPPQPRRHQSHSLFRSHNSQTHLSRTPSPARPMRQTMRETLPSDDELSFKKKSILMRKHPHKHHEGDRKRYRATVTERERRRYDGVWAANRGLWMDADSSESVVNFVVRDIWSRSRLPNDVLADIWDLVDIDGSDRLKRNEFVVGLWLIDQRLKGRKLPTMVSESLWNSVRLLHGVKVSRHQH